MTLLNLTVICGHRIFNYYKKALDLALTINGQNDQFLAEIYYGIGKTYFENSDFQNVLKNYNNAMSISYKSHGINLKYIKILFDIGMNYFAVNDAAKALKTYHKTLKLYKTHYENNHVEIMNAYIKISQVHISKDDFSKAIYYLKKAEKLANQENLGPAEREELLNGYASYYFYLGDYSQSIQYVSSLLNLKQKMHGNKSIKTGREIFHLGVINVHAGFYDNALYYLKKAKTLYTRFYKSYHPDLLNLYNSLSNLYCKIHDFRRAILYINRAIKIARSLHGEKNVLLGDCYMNLGNIYADQSKPKSGLKFSKKALEIYKKTLGANSSSSAGALINIGMQFNKSGEPKKATFYLKKALKINKMLFNESNPVLATNYLNLGVSLHKQSDFINAIKHYKKAHDIYKLTLGDQHQNVSHSLFNICLCYNALGDNIMAASYCERAINILIKALGKDNPMTRTQYNALISLLKDIGNDEKMQKYTTLFR